MTYDVVVVGAGPAGCAAAAGCAENGLKTLCIEEHGTIGYPVQCAGLLSNAALAECRVSGRSVLNRVSGARVITANGTNLQFDAKKTMAAVVDRGALDREMAENAARAGAEFLLKTTVCGIGQNALLVRGAHGPGSFPYRILIAADGPRGTIARLLGMERPRVFLAGIQADVLHDGRPGIVDIYPDASPGFFGWAIPTGPGRARVGLCGRTDVPALFSAFRKQFRTPTVHLVTGTLPLGVMPRTYGKRALFVGDAAGFAKPTSGGGVYTGIRSARHAAAVAVEACAANRFDDSLLSSYERRWQEDFGRELAIGFRLYEMRQRMSCEDTEEIVKALADPDIIRIIEEHGDMDRPAALVKKLFLRPGVIRLIRPLVQTGLKSFF